MKIISLDPGGTTGYSVGNLNKQEGMLRVKSDQYQFTHNMLYSLLITEHPDWIICESFEYRNRARAGLELISCELIGVVHLYTQQYKNRLTMQTASVGKGHFSDDKLKSDLLWIPGKPHAMDSLRHLLQWYTFGEGYQFNQVGYEQE